jgi:hypothetical protein
MSVRISGLLLGAALALTVTAAPAQELTPFQSQVLGGIKKMLVEYTQNQYASCSTSKRVCDIEQVEVLDEVLERWENTPGYGKYAVEVMDWHSQMATAIGEMASNYAVRHGGSLDAGFDAELLRRMAADPAFHPPKEYTCRHMFGTPHLYGSQGDFCK